MFEHFLENEKATIPFKMSTHQIQIFIKGEEKQSHVLTIFCNVDLIRFFDVWGEKRRKIIQHNESITKKCDYKKAWRRIYQINNSSRSRNYNIHNQVYVKKCL